MFGRDHGISLRQARSDPEVLTALSGGGALTRAVDTVTKVRIDIGRKEYSLTDSGRADQNHQVLDQLDAQVPWDEGGADLVGRLALEQGRRWS